MTQSFQDLKSSKPNIEVFSPFTKSYGDIIEEVAHLSGINLTRWQTKEVAKWSALKEDGKFLHKRVGASIPRQAGKSMLAIPYVIFLAIYLGAKVLWTDHNYSTTCEMIRRFKNILGSKVGDESRGIGYFNEKLVRVELKTAQEAFFFKAPYEGAPQGSIHFSTRTKTSALGFSFDIMVFDEAQELLAEHLQALIPTTTSGALHNPQYIYLGTPRRAGSPADRFERLREEARSDDRGADLAYTEYGLTEVGNILDESRWYQANPSLFEGVAEIEAIRSAISQVDRLAFAQEYLGVWLSPLELSGAGRAVITRKEWDKCSIHKPTNLAPLAYGIKFSVDGSYFAVSVAASDGEKIHVELIDKRQTINGKRALVEFAASRGTTTPLVIDGKSGANSFIERLSGIVPNYNIIKPTTADVISAADGFVDSISEQTLTWYKPLNAADGELDLLTEAVTTSYKRKIGNAGGWGFDGANSAVVESAALALWYAKLLNSADEQEIYF